MNKSALVLLTICLLGGALAVQGSECISNTKTAISHANQYVSDLKARTMHQIDLYEEGNTVSNEFSDINSECGFVSNDPATSACFQSIKQFLPTLSALVNAIGSSDFYGMETNGMRLFNQMDYVNSNCNSALSAAPVLSSTGFFDCADSGYKFYKAVADFQSNLFTAQISNAVIGAYKLVYSLQPLMDDCGIDINLNIPKIDLPDLSICDIDMGPLSSLIDSIQDNFKGGKFDKIFDDVNELVNNISQISVSCNTQKRLASPFFNNFLQCLKLTTQLQSDIDSIKSDYSEEEYPQLIVTGYNIIEGIQNLLNACQDTPVDLHIPQISQENLQDCVSNATDILSDLKAIKNDIATKNWVDLFSNVQLIISSLNDAQTDCSTASY